MRRLCLSLFCVVLALGTTAKADVIGWSCSNGTGGINSRWNGWTNSGGTCSLSIAGTQSSPAPGGITSTFTTDTPGDPTVKFINAVINDTAVLWGGYNVEVKIDTPLDSPLSLYALSNGTVTLPGNWSTTTYPFAYAGVVGGQNEYVGYLALQGGTPIANGDELDFSYKVSFAGSTQYTVTTVQTPVIITIPEPSTLALLAVGGVLGLGNYRRRRAIR